MAIVHLLGPADPERKERPPTASTRSETPARPTQGGRPTRRRAARTTRPRPTQAPSGPTPLGAEEGLCKPVDVTRSDASFPPASTACPCRGSRVPILRLT